MSAPQQLALLIADAVARRKRGEPVIADRAELSRLIVELGAADDDRAVDQFFLALSNELKRRGVKLPSLDHLPPEIAPLIGALGDELVQHADGTIDFEAAAARLDEAVAQTLGTSPRQHREAQLRADIRRDVAESVAASMRRHGLRPVADGDPPDEE